jgi:hypothetical protein
LQDLTLECGVASTIAPNASAAPSIVSKNVTTIPPFRAPIAVNSTNPTTEFPTTAPSLAVVDTPTTVPASTIVPSGQTTSDVPTDTPTSDIEVVASAQCVDNSQCAMLNLTGACCPTVDDWTLRCCGAPDIPIYQSCSNHSKCAAFDLEDACCPTADGTWLDCCGTVPDDCQAPGSCPIYSTAQYKLDLAAAEKAASNAVTIHTMAGVKTALFAVMLALVAL